MNKYKSLKLLEEQIRHEEIQNLTKTELSIVTLLVNGSRAKQIAYELNCSLYTVNTHISNIKKKLNCTNIFQLGFMLGVHRRKMHEVEDGDDE